MTLWHRLRASTVVRNGLALPLLLIPYWLKWQADPPPFDALYVMGFVLSAAMLLAIGLWLALGMPGLARYFERGGRLAWVLLWVLFIFWSLITQTWAFVGKQEPGVAQNFALQMLLVGSYCFMLACAAPSPRFVMVLLAINGVIAGLIGGAQVACQCSLGLKALGEVTLNVARSGISVIQGEGIRWLRPYGLMPHPNIQAGMVIVGVFAAASLLLTRNRGNAWHAKLLLWLLPVTGFLISVWMLLLSFSRGAWLGTGIGALAVLAGLISRHTLRRSLIALTLLMLLLGGLFFALYRPLIIARTGAGQENTEMRSLADRVVYMQIAQAAIAKAPVVGLGGGNTPWYASYYLAVYTDYDLQGDHVHNVYLEIWGDLGLIGLVLFGLLQVIGVVASIQSYRRTQDVHRLMMVGGWIALAVVGLADHYPWSLIMGQTLWMGLLAAAMSEAPRSIDSEHASD